MEPARPLTGVCPRCNGSDTFKSDVWGTDWEWTEVEKTCRTCNLVFVERVPTECEHKNVQPRHPVNMRFPKDREWCHDCTAIKPQPCKGK